MVVSKNTTIFALSINNLKKSIMKKVFLAIAIVSLIAVFMSSCRTGYGCRGNQSWEKMVRRNNRP